MHFVQRGLHGCLSGMLLGLICSWDGASKLPAMLRIEPAGGHGEDARYPMQARQGIERPDDT